ncbi:hypothetical protein [Fibrisoma limi]|nr:hypothetical protein [Fibrisoma limi]
MAKTNVLHIIFEESGVEYVARPATQEQKDAVLPKMKVAGSDFNCECGD